MINKKPITSTVILTALGVGLLVSSLLLVSAFQTVNVMGAIAENQAVEIAGQILENQFPDERVEAWLTALVERVEDWLPDFLSGEA